MTDKDMNTEHTAITRAAMRAVERCLLKACCQGSGCSSLQLRRSISEATSSNESGKTEVKNRRLQQIIKHLNTGYDSKNRITHTQKTDEREGTLYRLDNPYHLLFPEILLEEDRQTVRRLLAMAAFFQFPVKESMQASRETRMYERLKEDNAVIEELGPQMRGDVLGKFLKLYSAITRRRVVEIHYTQMRSATSTPLRVSPLMMRQFGGKWYLIAHENVPRAKRWSMFPLDGRLSDQITECSEGPHTEYYSEVNTDEIRAYYRHVYGLSVPASGLQNPDGDTCDVSNLKLCDVSFRVTDRKAFDYLRWNPIVEGQQPDFDTMRITIPAIVVSESLASRLMYWGRFLTDVQPQEMRVLLAKFAKEMVGNMIES